MCHVLATGGTEGLGSAAREAESEPKASYRGIHIPSMCAHTRAHSPNGLSP